jgi:hypothetical protein
MKTIDTHGTFEQAIATATEPVAAICRRLRDLIVEIDPETVEVPWPKQRIIGYGVGPKKMSEHYCYIGAFKNHANLGFYRGAGLPDPEGRMEGTGKELRHVKIRSLDAVDAPAVRALIQASILERQEALGLER